MKVIKVCQSGSCRANYGEATLQKAEATLGIKAGENTPDGKFRLETCGCLSNCDFGPNVFIGNSSESPLSLFLQDGKVENHMTPRNIELKIRELQSKASISNPSKTDQNSSRLPNL